LIINDSLDKEEIKRVGWELTAKGIKQDASLQKLFSMIVTQLYVIII